MGSRSDGAGATDQRGGIGAGDSAPTKSSPRIRDKSERGEGDGNAAGSVSFVERHAPDSTKPRRFLRRSHGLQLRFGSP